MRSIGSPGRRLWITANIFLRSSSIRSCTRGKQTNHAQPHDHSIRAAFAATSTYRKKRSRVNSSILSWVATKRASGSTLLGWRQAVCQTLMSQDERHGKRMLTLLLDNTNRHDSTQQENRNHQFTFSIQYDENNSLLAHAQTKHSTSLNLNSKD